jgi:hypothetical protein
MAQSICTTLSDGTKEWRKNGKLHRKNGPAIECLKGCKHWYKNGMPHRKDGPAVEHSDGSKEWWLYGEELEITDVLDNRIVQMQFPKLYESILNHKVEITCDGCGKAKTFTVRELVSGDVIRCDDDISDVQHNMNALLN